MGGAQQLNASQAGTTGQIVTQAQKAAEANGTEFNGAVIGSGMTAGASVQAAYDFIKEHYTDGEKVIVYGYSYGGDFAVDLAEKLKGDNIQVDLLITVDAADGPLMGTTVNRDIPDNVSVNVNEYQTTNSPMGSRGDKNTAQDASKTKVYNVDMSKVESVTHGSIDEVAKDVNSTLINKTMGIDGSNGTLNTVSSDKTSSRLSIESSVGSSSGSSSSSSFND
jgi:hypothetical protein